MTIYTICPDTLREGDWEELKETYADRLVAYAAKHIPPLPDHIRVREVVAPPDWRVWTHLDHHAFGLESGGRGSLPSGRL